MIQELLYYCSNCCYNIPNESEYKAHYRSDYHRYNIKRKIIGLQAVNYETFQQKFLESVSNTSQSSSKNQTFTCQVCNKLFLSNGTYIQHVNSSKHKEMLRLKEKKGYPDVQSLTSNQSENRKTSLDDSSVCLFCDRQTETNESCLDHMFKEHGFFIREAESLVDLEGLIQVLARLVNVKYTCIHCDGFFKDSLSTKQHMIDKGHCFMPKQEFQELSIFYDHSNKLKQLIMNQPIIELQEEEDDTDIILLQDTTNEQCYVFLSRTFDENGFVYNDEEHFEIVDLTEEQKLRTLKLKEYLSIIQGQKAQVYDNGEATLPSGKTIGHRSLRRFYKQNHIPFPTEINNMMINSNKKTQTQDLQRQS